MSLQKSKPNPLNYFQLRRVPVACPHFSFTVIDSYSPTLLLQLNHWIWNNLNSRYYIGQTLGLDLTNSLVYLTRIGFENEKELSFFRIACPDFQTR